MANFFEDNQGAQQQHDTRGATAGLPLGTRVLTLDGMLPVEYLMDGDRVITRAGVRVLRAIRPCVYSGGAVRIRADALGQNLPARDLILPGETAIVVRDWRAQAMFGQDQALVPVARLYDGDFITRVEVKDLRLVQLVFANPQIVYAGGLELASEPFEVPTPLA